MTAAPSNSDRTARIYTYEDLAKFGDGDLMAVLRRIPGVTVDTRPGDSLDDPKISLRGMGNGYTRVTIDGQPINALGEGVSLSQFPVDLVERIEMTFGGDARTSGEAIAGTLNIVLRESAKAGLQVSAGLVASKGHTGSRTSLLYHAGAGAWQWQLLVSGMQLQTQPDRDLETVETFPPTGERTLYQREYWQRHNHDDQLSLIPSLQWRDGSDLLSAKWLMEYGHQTAPGSQIVTQHEASFPAFYQSAQTAQSNLYKGNMLTLRWQHALQSGGTFISDLSQRQQRSRSDFLWLAETPDHEALDPDGSLDHDHLSQSRLHAGWDIPLGTGWRGQWGGEWQREQMESDSLSPGDDAPSFSEMRRTQSAAYARAVWHPLEALDLSAGLRHESALNPVPGQDRRHDSIWLPSLNAVWTLDEAEQQQLSFNAARTLRAPRMKDLRRNIRRSGYNQAAMPDQTGNPLLVPELSTGIELGYQVKGTSGISWGVNAFDRRIQDVIQPVLAQQADGRWLLKPFNTGNAHFYGTEWSLNWHGRESALNWPVSAHLNYSRYTSRLSTVASPYNSLAGQPAAVLDIGADYAWTTLGIEAGVNYHMQPAYTQRTSDVQSTLYNHQDTLDVYVSYQASRSVSLKLAIDQLLQHDVVSQSNIVQKWGGVQTVTIRQHQGRVVNLSVEARF
ncbi:TonB-dependent receptor [Burkholderiaceae bacterium DAT-1]|nr:TonB-dependent receptor [Burkholderiaceae bacterium DAT-1]